MNQILKTAKSRNHISVLFCIGGILLNLLLSTITSSFDLPIYLDTIGTILVAVTGGYLPGVLVGFTTNVLKCIYDPASLYYGIFNILIAVFAAYLSKRGWLKSIGGILGITAAFALVGGGLGSLIPLLTTDINNDSEFLKLMLYRTGIFDIVSAHIAASLIWDFVDKLISVVLTLLILRFVPKNGAAMRGLTGGCKLRFRWKS